MNKIINKMFVGMVFTVIPIVLMTLVSKIGFHDFFKFIFLTQIGIVSFIAQGFLAERYRNTKK